MVYFRLEIYADDKTVKVARIRLYNGKLGRRLLVTMSE